VLRVFCILNPSAAGVCMQGSEPLRQFNTCIFTACLSMSTLAEAQSAPEPDAHVHTTTCSESAVSYVL
jgi:hypothetical protein